MCPSVQSRDWCPCEVCASGIWRALRQAAASPDRCRDCLVDPGKCLNTVFLGFAGYYSKAPFDSSIMLNSPKRFSGDDHTKINELIAERGQAMVLEAV